MKPRLIGVCVVFAFHAAFFMGPPDLISQFMYGIYSAVLCAVLVTVSQKVLSKRKMSERAILAASILCTIFSPPMAFLANYLIYKATA
jgi:hypothetical protein